jgi:N-acyl-D-amino-acid deacylase
MAAGHDLLLRGGILIDGSGAKGRMADIAIKADRIAAIGAPGALDAKEVIDVAGLCVSPGFIDVHTHDDRLVMIDPQMGPKVSQGVSTVVVGNCGLSLAPLVLGDREPPQPLDSLGRAADFRFARMADYLSAVEKAAPAVNVAALAGHTSLRLAVMDDLSRPAAPAEIEAMRQILATALKEGAIGLSTGLFNPSAKSATMDEVVTLARELAAAGGIYATHMRDENDFVLESLEESFETGRRAEVPIVISHHKCAGRENWGRSHATLAAIEAASARQEVGVDAYPYTACSWMLKAEAVDEQLRTVVTWSSQRPECAGRDLADIAAEWGVSQKQACARLVPAGAVYFDMDEDDVRRILAHPMVMVGSDGIPHDAHPHPRLWGAFARVLGHYARDVGLFPLEEAVRKMTKLPATRFRLTGRGELKPGYFADICVFDPATIADAATYERPIAAARGIEMVLVNGICAYRGGQAMQGRGGGRVLRIRARGEIG